jgi:hypothetical protein
MNQNQTCSATFSLNSPIPNLLQNHYQVSGAQTHGLDGQKQQLLYKALPCILCKEHIKITSSLLGSKYQHININSLVGVGLFWESHGGKRRIVSYEKKRSETLINDRQTLLSHATVTPNKLNNMIQ